MGGRQAFLLACVLAYAGPASAQAPASDGVDVLLTRLQTVLQTGGDFGSLAASDAPAEEIAQFAADLRAPDTRRAVVLERDRAPLSGVLPGDGYRLVVEVFTESAARARIVTAMFDVRRPSGGAPETWRITGARAVSAIDGLFRLRVNPDTRFLARNLTVSSEDFRLTLTEGSVFLVESEAGTTGLVLLGNGVMRFAPQPPTEQGQLRMFSGAEVLNAPFDTAFVRLNPGEYEERVSVSNLSPAPASPRDLRRAQEILAREGPQSFSLDLSDLSSEVWYLLPPFGDFMAQVRTRRHGTLTYSRAGMQAEDITLVDRERRRTIALYPSTSRRAAYGLTFNEDDHRDYDVLDYDIEANITPETETLQGRALMRIKVRSAALASLTLRLSSDLAVRSIVSQEYGRLLHVRVRDQDNVIVNLPLVLTTDSEINLLVTYAGRLTSQEIEDEALQLGGDARDEPFAMPEEPKFMLSSRSYWYPQNPVTDYATATMRFIVPEGFGCVASGQPRQGTNVTMRDLLTMAEGQSFVFTAREPLRYFAVMISRFVRAAEGAIPIGSSEAVSGSVALSVEANPRLRDRGKAVLADVENIMKFYTSLIGEAPYDSMTVALVEDELPGGHSPGYFAVLNNPLPRSRFTWRTDPAAFTGFPEFFIAHELAHQWWGQAVGWRNYHDQWLSEGLAQYFAALYAQKIRGERTFTDMLRQFRRWAIAETDEGPISLGNRLGHIRREPRVFRALVYNKAAAVLHTLRRLLGDEHFFAGLRRFYEEQKFRKAGTDDLRIAFETVSGRSLERFFAQWIYGVSLPQLRYSTVVGTGGVTVRFEQTGPEVFELPVTVTVVYADGRMQDATVVVANQQVETTLATTGVVKQVQVNRDSAAVALIQ